MKNIYISFILLVLLSQKAFPQKYNNITDIFYTIDSLEALGQPQAALKELDKLSAIAKNNKNNGLNIKIIIYKIKFLTYLQEDAIAKIVAALQAEIKTADFPVKNVLHSLLGEIYSKYYQQNGYRISQRSDLSINNPDFTYWNIQKLLMEADLNYRASLNSTSLSQQTNIAVLDGVLAGDQSNRKLRPTVYDLLLHRALEFYFSKRSVVNKPLLPQLINSPEMFVEPILFNRIKIDDNEVDSHHYLKGLKLIQEATVFHLNANRPEALADLELARLKFIYENTRTPARDTLYVKGLRRIAKQKDAGIIRIDALTALATYYSDKRKFTEAVSVLEEIAGKFQDSIKTKDALKNIASIKKDDFSAQFESFNLPGEAILGLLSYKNVEKLTINIYKIPDNELDNLVFKEALNNRNNNKLTAVKNALVQLPVTRKQVLILPEKNDYQQHQIEFKVDALPAGNYFLLLENAVKRDSFTFCISNFAVSNIAVLNTSGAKPETQILVLNRKTGKPIPNAKIAIEAYNRTAKEYITIKNNVNTDKEGLFLLTEEQDDKFQYYNFKIIKDADTLRKNSVYIRTTSAVNRRNIVEYNTAIFTDREIYRPGQTIYFKGIIFEKNNQKANLAINYPVKVVIKSQANKEIASLNLTTNEFGSFTGTFIIPVTILNGDLRFFVNDRISKNLKVEEYKRPTFEISLTPEKENYNLTDSIIYKGKVSTYTGFALPLTKINYDVVRNLNFVANAGNLDYRKQDVLNDTLLTDANGEFSIKFKAEPYDFIKLKDQRITYQLNVSATDAGGETQSKSESLWVAQNNLYIAVNPIDFVSKSDTGAIKITLRNLNYKPVKATIKAEVFALETPANYTRNKLWTTAAEHGPLLSASDFKKFFPAYSPVHNGLADAKRLKIIESVDFKAEDSQFNLYFNGLKKQSTGFYELKIGAVTADGDSTSISRYFYFLNTPETAIRPEDWLIAEKTNVLMNEKAHFILTIPNSSVLMEVYDNNTLIRTERINTGKKPKVVELPLQGREYLDVNFLMAYDNRIYNKTHRVNLKKNIDNLNIQLISFRDKMQPGEKEQVKLRIVSNTNKIVASEMLATLYDASLDALTAPQSWSVNFNRAASFYKNPSAGKWNTHQFNQSVTSLKSYYHYYNPLIIKRNYEQLDLGGYAYYGGYNSSFKNYTRYIKNLKINHYEDSLIKVQYNLNAEKVKDGFDFSGRTIDPHTGYGIAGVIISIEGTLINTVSNSFGYFRIKVPENSVLVFRYKGIIKQKATADVKKSYQVITINTSSEVSYETFYKRDLTGSVAGVGDGALNEVNVISYGSPVDIMLRGSASTLDNEYIIEDNKTGIFTNVDDSSFRIRKNFNETAFFYPQLKTNENGVVNIDFTLPESLTRWRFKAFAHDKDLNSILVDKEITAQKTLMLSPNMPRFLRAGDTVKLSMRVINLSNGTLKTTLNAAFFDALSNTPLDIKIPGTDNEFLLKPNSNETANIEIAVPENIEAISYRFTAVSGTHSDGEENTIPVLPNSILVTESMPLLVKAGEKKTFNFDKLVNNQSSTLNHKSLTLEFTANPNWLVAEALPYLGEVKFDCGEHVFSAWYANKLSGYIIKKNPVIKKVFEQWKNLGSDAFLSNLEKNMELKSLLIEETPWLRQAENEAERKKRIALLFDMNQLEYQQSKNLQSLKQLQLQDGSFPWMSGLRTDRFISQHILAGLGQLNKLGINDNHSEMNNIRKKLLDFVDKQLSFQNEQKQLNLHAWYASSYFNSEKSDALNQAWQQYVKEARAKWLTYNVYQQALMALTLDRNGEKELAARIRKSIADRAIQSKEMGVYWPKTNWGCFWYELPIETQCLLIELFRETEPQSKLLPGMQLWLLRQKQVSNWRSTKATAAACYVLLHQPEMLAATKLPEIKVGGKDLSLIHPNLKGEAGTGYVKASWQKNEIKPALGKVEISNAEHVSWGAMYWQYTEKSDKIKPSENGLTVSRKYYLQEKTKEGDKFREVDKSNTPKTGDRLKVVINIKSDRDFEYIHLKDLRSAATEPAEVISKYRFQDGLFYYQVNKDASTNFFINYLPKGNYVFEYELNIAQTGVFNTGITTIESMYAPEYRSNSEGKIMKID